MLGLRCSVGELSDVSHHLLLTMTFHGIRVRSIHEGSAEIPDHKRFAVSLQSIYGIGRNRGRQILSELNLDNKPSKELTGRELMALCEHGSSTYVIGELLI